MVTLTLPWPPSVNHYWRRNGNRYFVSSEGRKYREEVCLRAKDVQSNFAQKDRLSVSIKAYPPDKRRRDLDNILKSLLDSLQHAGVYSDDSQIDSLHIERSTPLSSRTVVSVSLIDQKGMSSSDEGS